MRTYIHKSFYSLLVCLLLFSSCGAGRSLKQAEQSYAQGEYFDAARHYKQAYARTSPKDRPRRAVLAYKQGDCYRRINYTLKAKSGLCECRSLPLSGHCSSFLLGRDAP